MFSTLTSCHLREIMALVSEIHLYWYLSVSRQILISVFTKLWALRLRSEFTSIFPVPGIVVVGPYICLEWMNKCLVSTWCLKTEGGRFARKSSPYVAQAGKGKPKWKGTSMGLEYQRMTGCVHAKLLQLCLSLCNAMDHSLPGSSVHGILQARILEWVAMPSSRGSSWPRDLTRVSYVSCIVRWVLYH